MSRRLPKLLKLGVVLLVLGTVLAVATAGVIWWQLAPHLPDIQTLKDVRLQTPLRVYSDDYRLMAEFGEKRRNPVRLEHLPETMTQAILAAEDDRFYEHPGVDWQGLTRAAIHLLRTGEKGQGGSTITMQVARNFFLGREKTYLRKLNEIILALKIEDDLSKAEILELYLNKIYLGHRSYGVGAAAQVYYGRPISELSLAEQAMIAGLPKAPSRYNPIVNPSRAVTRRNYVLGRMRELGFITEEQYQQEYTAEVTARLHGLSVEVDAPYVAEMVRAHMVQRYGDDAYTTGYRVYTSIKPALQEAANRAVNHTLLAYDRRHGYRGAEDRVRMPDAGGVAEWRELLAGRPVVGGLRPALVTGVEERSASIFIAGKGEAQIDWTGLEWARPYSDENRRGPVPKTAAEVLSAGDVVRVRQGEEGAWQLSQIPDVSGALVAVDPEDGGIVALTGGLDFYHSKFNRITQAKRQPGSNFKPFIYSAALNEGYTPASLINDAPVVFDDPGLEAAWRPENYSGKFYGPTRMRVALTHSRNLVSIRLLRAIGIRKALEYVRRFGFEPNQLPHDLSLALGSGSITPLQLASGYAVFANGGYKVEPYFIKRIVEADGELVYAPQPATVCRPCEAGLSSAGEARSNGEEGLDPEQALLADLPANPAPRVMPAGDVWQINSMLKDVVRRGTGRRALKLGRKDLAGKTGTTNDQRDAWFSGFNQSLVSTVWIGFDRVRPLGRKETGSRAALPMWIDFMREALDGVPESEISQPEGLVTVRIDPETGHLAGAEFPKAIFETFRVAHVPTETVISVPERIEGVMDNGGDLTEQLF